MLGDFNINRWHHGEYIFSDNKVLSSVKGKDINVIQYQEFCSLHGRKQLIKSPTRITEHKSSLLNHGLTNSCEKLSQSGMIDIAVRSSTNLLY